MGSFFFIASSQVFTAASPRTPRMAVRKAWKLPFEGAQPILPRHLGLVRSFSDLGRSATDTRSGL